VFIAGVVYTSNNPLQAIVVATGNKFIAGAVDTGD
jgi:hypothetical protein